MSLSFSDAARSARAQAVIDQLDQGATPGTIALYATPQPLPGAAAGGSPLVTLTLQRPCGNVANGVLSFAATPPAQVNPGGTALWARATDGNGHWVLDGNVAVTGTPGAAFTLDSVSLTAGAFVFLSAAATLTEP